MTPERAELLLQVIAAPEPALKTFIKVIGSCCPGVASIAQESPALIREIVRNGVTIGRRQVDIPAEVAPEPADNVVYLFRHRRG